MIANAGPEDRVSGMRKAAMLIVVLGEEVSGEVLRNLTEEERVGRLRQRVEALQVAPRHPLAEAFLGGH